MLFSILLLAVQADDVVVSIREPSSASPWHETYTARCGRQDLEIRRPMRPLQSPPEVLLSGRRPQGDLSTLEAELSQAGAAYRMAFTCSQNNETMQLRWVSGLPGERGQIRYRAGSAMFREGSLVESRAEESTAETFWYR